MKKTFKDNKVLFVLAIIIIVALVLMAIGLVSYFYGNNKSPYGDRLNGIENYKLKETLSSDIKELLGEKVSTVKIETKGKIVYVIIDVDKETNKIEAKELATQSLEKFTVEEKSFYDIQYLITCEKEVVSEDEVKSFPIEGYKNSSSNAIIWTNN